MFQVQTYSMFLEALNADKWEIGKKILHSMV